MCQGSVNGSFDRFREENGRSCNVNGSILWGIDGYQIHGKGGRVQNNEFDSLLLNYDHNQVSATSEIVTEGEPLVTHVHNGHHIRRDQ